MHLKKHEGNERHADGKAFSTVTCLVKVRLWMMENPNNVFIIMYDKNLLDAHE